MLKYIINKCIFVENFGIINYITKLLAVTSEIVFKKKLAPNTPFQVNLIIFLTAKITILK